MREIDTHVVVIGGGATGVGILRDLSLRGIPALLLEQGDLAHGTSSRFHGLLHSGGRYAVKDDKAAQECIEENRILKHIAAHCIKDTSGWFIYLKGDDPNYLQLWLKGCAQTGITVKEIPLEEAFRLEPLLTRQATRVFEVPDATVDGFKLLWANVKSAEKYGGNYRTYCKVKSLWLENRQVKGVYAEDFITGETLLVRSKIVVNAAGPWSSEIAAMSGFDVHILKNKGSLLVFNKRLFNRVINRLRTPGDGEIFVPHETVTIFGTTSHKVESPDDHKVDEQDVAHLIEMGQNLVEEIEQHRIVRAFAGIRPLYESVDASDHEGRGISRNFVLIDHEKMDGVRGLVSIVGGKLTTYRLMAEKVTDWVAAKLEVHTVCRTAEEPLQNELPTEVWDKARQLLGTIAADKMMERLNEQAGSVVEAIARQPLLGQFVCECEMVTQAEVLHALQDLAVHSLDDLRHQTRLGMGTCQGAYCTYRATPMIQEAFGGWERTVKEYQSLLGERWRGITPVLWGEQLRESELARALYLNVLDFKAEESEG
ncbi:anaerobic glycerol-3-phosphate dehydrogenase subunit GlpA [Desulfosporosinus sp. BICA1-9]|uniref:anaerobic glycerol-3-phosphate dehydrogenase subunit GlpA n=1 Tax=Desulfosporosinus sp. BICA1-9 TaxID=1531958 RepID=UPI00054B003A|nr:anaerobic glycerol-3-phosphate dehydrogenase subunit GlpA [Desulfosporosinus sp. BICA1-9]KJS49651.1 MAG: glycerol-3-phosphate dehydrogenase [Peptococcaceae bacterium BRH_c23]KJS86053.1 MAG: glycerol-3-phosphate dehydrogenase [Desulfosporosinus sp. BICA1-9]HBW34900.1 anaerobic glycerol-3-phosphate dehydrogenase subunit A [Desulfosporosinus sp.]